jgi:hypothetical protein
MKIERAEGLLRSGDLVWFYDRGIGYVDPQGAGSTPYNEDYQQEYENRAASEIGYKLIEARRKLVERHWSGEANSTTPEFQLLDFGAGYGAFVQHMRSLGFNNVYGYDVNPFSCYRLIENGWFADPYKRKWRHISFWDSLEHLPDPEMILRQASHMVFMSLPIFEAPDKCRVSKHFKPMEHVYYYSERGLIRMMREFGFDLAEVNDEEVQIGREEVLSFAFRRIL